MKMDCLDAPPAVVDAPPQKVRASAGVDDSSGGGGADDGDVWFEDDIFASRPELLLLQGSSGRSHRFQQRSFSESADRSSFLPSLLDAARAAEEAAVPPPEEDVAASSDEDDVECSGCGGDAGRPVEMRLRAVPRLPSQGPAFLRWSHYHVFAPRIVLYPALRSALATHATVLFDRRQWKFKCEMKPHGAAAPAAQLSLPAAAVADSGAGAGAGTGDGGAASAASAAASAASAAAVSSTDAAADASPRQQTAAPGLSRTQSSPQLTQRSRFTVRVHLADVVDQHHVVEFASSSMLPRAFKAVFMDTMHAVRASSGVHRVVVLPPTASSPLPVDVVRERVSAHVDAETWGEQLPTVPSHVPTLPSGASSPATASHSRQSSVAQTPA